MTKAGDHGRSHTDRIVLEQCFGGSSIFSGVSPFMLLISAVG